MALLSLSTDYTDRDFDAIRARLRLLITSVFPTWTDDRVANFGNILVELFAFATDVLTYYQDNQARESRIGTATQRRSLIALAKLVGYVPSGRTAASVDETFTLSAAAAAEVTLPAGDRVLTAEVTNPIAYQLLEDLVFAIGETVKTVSVENTQSREEVFTTDGTANQEFRLTDTPYVDGSAAVADATEEAFDADTNPDGWQQVDTFLDSDGTDPHFVVVIDEQERGAVRFGNGVNGRLPVGNVTVTYKVGGGLEGRVEAAKLVRLARSYTDANGTPVTISVTNASASSGGEDRESEELIRQNAPASLRVLERAVAREDYEISALAVPGVARAFHGTLNEGLGVGENEGRLFIVPVGGGTPSSELLETVTARFGIGGATPKTNTYQLTVVAAAYLTIDVRTTIYIRKGFSSAQAKASVLAALQAHFAVQNANGSINENVNFGYHYQDEDGEPTGLLPWSDVHNAIRDAAGVRKVDAGNAGLLLNDEHDDVTIGVFEFPKLGDVVVIDGTTGDVI